MCVPPLNHPSQQTIPVADLTCAVAQVLNLSHNRIGDAGMSALSGACASGALDKLEMLMLHANQIGDEGMKALAAAVAGGALDKLESLGLFSNPIGDEGMKALAEAVARGALPSLQRIVVDTRHERHPALVAACRPRNITIA